MEFSTLTSNLPFLAVAAGALLLAWSQKEKILSWVPKLNSKSLPELRKELSPAELFDTFYALRSWCVSTGYMKAVCSLDDCVLPAIVRTEGPAVEEETPDRYDFDDEDSKQ